jgi:nucleoside-diphosphate-sugar epimerase
MKVFLTGVTGYIGSAIASELIEKGHHVIGLVRSDSKSAKQVITGVEIFQGDLKDADSIRKGVALADAVIHAAFGHDDWMKMEASYARDRAIVTVMLDALAGSDRPFVYTSGTGVLGNTGDTLADESTIPAPQQGVQDRVETEKSVIAAAARGIRTSVIRPGLVYGPGSGPMVGVMIDLAKRAGVPTTIGNGLNAWSAVHIEDLASLYCLAIEKSLTGKILHAVSGEPVVMRDLAVAIGRAAGLGSTVQVMQIEDARTSIGMLADAMAMNKRVTAAIAVSLGWKPNKPSLLSEIESGNYNNLLIAKNEVLTKSLA